MVLRVFGIGTATSESKRLQPRIIYNNKRIRICPKAFRFNERKHDDKGRFLQAIANFAGKGLTMLYCKLIDQGGDGLSGTDDGNVADGLEDEADLDEV